MLDDAVDIILDDDRWLARVYLNAAHPEYLDIVDQWGAEGDSLQTLEHFIRVWKEPVRLVPGSYGTPI